MRPISIVVVAGLALAAAPVPAFAQSGEAARDFTFKRVTVGKRPTGSKRITVQIDPDEQARLLELNPAVPLAPDEPPATAAAPDASDTRPGPAPTAAYAWFWDLLSPDLASASSGRLERAEAALGAGPNGASVRTPRLATLQRIADSHGSEILKATIGTEVSPALALAVISVESAGRSDALSHAGASGLMQLMPATAERFGVTDRADPAQNIQGGVAYLDWLLGHFGRDPLLALAGYNAGEGAVQKHGGVPPYRETRDYVPKVLAAWTVAKGLCMTPPQLVSDGCVFRRSAAAATTPVRGGRG